MIENPDYYRKIYIADERIKRLEETEVHYRLQEQYIDELEQCIRAANDRIKRLEKAGDAMHRAWIEPLHFGRQAIWANWLKAREVKP